ncbi:phage tail spike protein [Alkalihalobacillus macyae]|uniref:phage tail spike protein n=1 Tax=Guptibacillus hwajinpoensis TaxID=208199 RepID=UPI00273BC546|nr:phage tail spike protein [Alkalihalobacillus macyae]MDP4549859.1 phage tail spike protein [Alkalihalobacillus macyae]
MIQILDKEYKILATLRNDASDSCPYYYDKEKGGLQNLKATYEFEIPVSHPDSKYVIGDNYVSFLNEKGHFSLYQIKNVKQTHSIHNSKYAYCESDVYDLYWNPILPQRLAGATVNQALDFCLGGTKWKRGYTEQSVLKSIKIEDITHSFELLLRIIETFNMEVVVRVEMDEYGVTGRFIDLVKEKGEYHPERIEYSKNLNSISKEENTMNKATAVLPYATGLDDGDFLYIDMLNEPDSPTNVFWIGDEKARIEKGLNIHQVITYKVEGDADNLSMTFLYEQGKKELARRVKSTYTYEVDAHLLGVNYNLGDSVTIIDDEFQPELILEARVIDYERSRTDPTINRVTFGEYVELKRPVPSEVQAIRTKLELKEKYWDEKITKITSPTPPEDTTAIWVVEQGEGIPAIQFVYSDSQGGWVKTTATEAGEVGAYTKSETNDKVDPLTQTIDRWSYPDSTKINGTEIESETISFSQARGGVVRLGEAGGGELRVFDLNSDNELDNIGEITKDGAFFPVVITEKLIAPNKLEAMPVEEGIQKEIYFYVDNVNGDDENEGMSINSPKRTVQAVINSLPPYLNGDITITMLATGEDQEEDIEIIGFVGYSFLTITSESGFKRLAGNILIQGCTIEVIFDGCALKCINETGIHVKIETCSKVEFNIIKFLGENLAGDGMRAYNASVYFNQCELYRYTNAAITSGINGRVGIRDCKGDSNKYGVWAYNGGIVTGGGTCPKGTTSNTRESNGQILATFTMDAGTTPSQDPVVTTKTSYVNASSSGAWRPNFGGQWYQSVPYQGEWSGYGLYRGCWFFGSDLNFLSGKTIKALKIKVKRASRGGDASNSPIVFRAHDHSSKPSGMPSWIGSSSVTSNFDWNEEKWVDITSLKSYFQSGSAKGMMIYTTSTSDSSYAYFAGSCQIKVIYES